MINRLAFLLLVSSAGLFGQSGAIVTDVKKGGNSPNMAVSDVRGAAGAQGYMSTFNATLFGDLQDSGLFKMVPKSFYPLQVPQRPEDFKPTSGQGLAMADWAGTPVNANYLAFGYTAVQNGQLVLYGWLYDVRQPTLQSAQVIGSRYFGSPDEAGARKVAHEFASEIIQKFGGGTLAGSHIYFVSDRSGKNTKEIWVMDYDGQNQRQLTFYHSIAIQPALSPDGTRLAFTSFDKGTPRIVVLNTATGRPVQFYNQEASLNANPSFSPDGKEIYYSSTAAGHEAQIYAANLNGTNFRRIGVAKAIQVEPKVNPKNGSQIAFVQGPKNQQVFVMNTEGANLERVTNGEGEASNPAWHPDGQHLLFAWTRGYATGNFNVFLMDATTREYDQLTSNAGRNENPSWGPDGRHLVFVSNRTGQKQIWTMLANGAQLNRLTSTGNNESPVWGK
jgi:TolB protein